MAELANWAELWCQVFGYSSCYGLSRLEAAMLSGAACLAAVFAALVAFSLIMKLVD